MSEKETEERLQLLSHMFMRALDILIVPFGFAIYQYNDPLRKKVKVSEGIIAESSSALKVYTLAKAMGFEFSVRQGNDNRKRLVMKHAFRDLGYEIGTINLDILFDEPVSEYYKFRGNNAYLDETKLFRILKDNRDTGLKKQCLERLRTYMRVNLAGMKDAMIDMFRNVNLKVKDVSEDGEQTYEDLSDSYFRHHMFLGKNYEMLSLAPDADLRALGGSGSREAKSTNRTR